MPSEPSREGHAPSRRPRADSPDEFVFDDGPIHRYVAQLGRGTGGGVGAEYSLAGGVSGVPASPLFTNLLRAWLTNEYATLP